MNVHYEIAVGAVEDLPGILLKSLNHRKRLLRAYGENFDIGEGVVF